MTEKQFYAWQGSGSAQRKSKGKGVKSVRKRKITELKNGKIKIEAFGLREWCKTSHHDDGFWDEKNPEPLCICDGKGNERNAIAG